MPRTPEQLHSLHLAKTRAIVAIAIAGALKNDLRDPFKHYSGVRAIIVYDHPTAKDAEVLWVLNCPFGNKNLQEKFETEVMCDNFSEFRNRYGDLIFTKTIDNFEQKLADSLLGFFKFDAINKKSGNFKPSSLERALEFSRKELFDALSEIVVLSDGGPKNLEEYVLAMKDEELLNALTPIIGKAPLRSIADLRRNRETGEITELPPTLPSKSDSTAMKPSPLRRVESFDSSGDAPSESVESVNSVESADLSKGVEDLKVSALQGHDSTHSKV